MPSGKDIQPGQHTTTRPDQLVRAMLAKIDTQIAARMSPEALLSAEDVGAMLGYTARYIRETIALAPGLPSAIRLQLDTDGKRILSALARTLHRFWIFTSSIENYAF